MTETLARVYLEQKNIKKAILRNINYEISSSFFADRITDIKILQQNNN
jgi:hypothetical protein